MQPIYEKTREDYGLLITDFSPARVFPPHYHGDVEVFLVLGGAWGVSLAGENHVLTGGYIAVADSYEVHGYYQAEDLQAKQDNGKACVIILPPRFLQALGVARGKGKIANPVFCDETLCNKLYELAKEHLSVENGDVVRAAAAELFVTLLCTKLRFTSERAEGETSLMRRMLAYVQENYKKDVSLADMARELGYTQAHLSRVFHRYMRRGFSQYVNALRLDYVLEQKKGGDKRKVIDLIYEAGFQSQQTYYRWMKRLQNNG